MIAKEPGCEALQGRGPRELNDSQGAARRNPSFPLECGLRESPVYRVVKRAADVVIATGAIIVLSPVFVLTSILIVLEDGGPILYRQRRVGKFGVPFWFYKFRSMHLDADATRAALQVSCDSVGPAFKMRRDPRTTRLGRFIRKYSIDELPQLFLVLSGKMSIVGPRPHLPQEVGTYSRAEMVRLAVKPGLLCLREVRGRSELTFDEWVQLDLQYIASRSLLLDAQIFLEAFGAVLKADGAY